MTLFALRLRNSDVESPRAMANASQSDTSARVANRLNRSVLPAWEGFVTSSLDQTCIPLFLVFQSAVTVTLPPNRTAVLKATNLGDDDTNGETDVFVHDRKTGKTERPYRDKQGRFVLGDPAFGSELHHRKNAVLTGFGFWLDRESHNRIYNRIYISGGRGGC